MLVERTGDQRVQRNERGPTSEAVAPIQCTMIQVEGRSAKGARSALRLLP